MVSIVSYSRLSLMIIASSRGLLRDYDPSDLLQMELFEALMYIHVQIGEL